MKEILANGNVIEVVKILDEDLSGNALNKSKLVSVSDNTISDLIITGNDAKNVILVDNIANGSPLTISTSPLSTGDTVVISSKKKFKQPVNIITTYTHSTAKELGTWNSFNIVNITNGKDTALLDIPIASIVKVSQLITITLNTEYTGQLGDWISIYGISDSRYNFANLVVDSISLDKKTITSMYNNGVGNSATSLALINNEGYISFETVFNNYKKGYAIHSPTSTLTYYSYLLKNPKYDSAANTIFSTQHTSTASKLSTMSSYGSYEQCTIKPPANSHIAISNQGVYFADNATSTVSNLTARANFTYNLHDENDELSWEFIYKTSKSRCIPVAKIKTITKTGTTTATVTTHEPHGLSVNSYVNIYGVADSTNFPNLTAETKVASIVSTTEFTIVIGTATTSSSYGGVVTLINYSTLLPNINTNKINSYSITNDILTITASANWSGIRVGDHIELYGCTKAGGTLAEIDGGWRVNSITTTKMSLIPLFDINNVRVSPTLINTASTVIGGQVFLRQVFRLFDVKINEFTEQNSVKLVGQGEPVGLNNALPVNMVNFSTFVSATCVQSTGAAAANAATTGWIIKPNSILVTDAASAAITTSTTTAAISLFNNSDYAIMIPVTAVSGTNPSLDVVIQETMDGTNWFDVFHFPTIRAVGQYYSPIIKAKGYSFRYVHTIAGTSPSFTRILYHGIYNFVDGAKFVRQMFNKSLVLNTVNVTTPAIELETANSILYGGLITAATTNPTIALQGSIDNVNWMDISSTTLVPNIYNSQVINTPLSYQFLRIINKTAGTGVTLNHLFIKAA